MPMQPVMYIFCVKCQRVTLHYIKRMGDMVSEMCDVCKANKVRSK